MAVIFDIDGVLADCSHRLHYVKELPQHWTEFYDAMHNDLRIKPMANLAIDLSRSNRVMLVTGRPEAYRDKTVAWLSKYGITFGNLFMRADKDFRPDYVIKKEILDRIRGDGYSIEFAIEDSPAVVDMYNSNGVLCLAMPRSETK